MIGFELALEGEEWYGLYWRDLGKGIEQDLVHLCNRWARRIQAELRREAPHDTGTLSRSIVAYVTGIISDHLIMVDLGVPWGVYQEFGTGIHSEWEGASRQPIRAKPGSALSIAIERSRGFYAASGNADAYGPRPQAGGGFAPRAVTGYIFRFSQEGSKPQFFVRSTLTKFEREIEDDLDKALRARGFM